MPLLQYVSLELLQHCSSMLLLLEICISCRHVRFANLQNQ